MKSLNLKTEIAVYGKNFPHKKKKSAPFKYVKT